MSRSDDGLRAEIQRWLPKPDWMWTPIESGGTHGGIPDSHWTHRPTRTHGWTEHKATTGWAVGLRPHQVGWLERHAAAGVRCTIAVRARGVGSAGGAGDSLWLLRGEGAGVVAELGLRCPPALVLGVWRGPPSGWDWAEVTRLLTES